MTIKRVIAVKSIPHETLFLPYLMPQSDLGVDPRTIASYNRDCVTIVRQLLKKTTARGTGHLSDTVNQGKCEVRHIHS